MAVTNVRWPVACWRTAGAGENPALWHWCAGVCRVCAGRRHRSGGLRRGRPVHGEFSGYSSDRSTNNVLRVDTLLRRKDAWLVDVMGGRYAEHLTLARLPREAEMSEAQGTFSRRHRRALPKLRHAFSLLRGTGSEPRRRGAARSCWPCSAGTYLKTVIAVDSDIDISDDSQVLWALATHFQPHLDIFTIGNAAVPLDPSSSVNGTTSRMGLDATRGSGFDGIKAQLDQGRRTRAATAQGLES